MSEDKVKQSIAFLEIDKSDFEILVLHRIKHGYSEDLIERSRKKAEGYTQAIELLTTLLKEEEIYKDIRGNIIKAGDKLRNEWNDPPEVEVLEDVKGNLYLGDMDTPFGHNYAFDRFWIIV